MNSLRIRIYFLFFFLIFASSCIKERDNKFTFSFNNSGEPESLDPAVVAGTKEGHILIQIFEGLTSLHPKTVEPIPGVAKKWGISADGLKYKFYLRKDAKWTNGRRVTAHDFVYSWERLLNPAQASQYAFLAYFIKNGRAYNSGHIKDSSKLGIKAISDEIFEVTLENPTPFFLSITSWYVLYPVCKEVVEKHGVKWTRPENIVTNGPFILEKWKPQNYILLAKNPMYWDAAKVKLNKIKIYPVENLDTGTLMFIAGQIDWNYSLPSIKLPALEKRKDFHVAPFLGSYFYRVNTKKSLLADIKVRKALSFALEREKITKYVTRGGEMPAFSYVPSGIPDYNSPKVLTENIPKAKELLKEAGFPGGKGFPKISILFNTSESHKKIAEAIQAMWKKNLGIDIELINQEWQVFLANEKAMNYEISRGAWIGDYLDPNTFLELFTSDSPGNKTGWKNQEYDKIIKLCSALMDLKKRNKEFKKAEEILLSEMPIIPIYIYTKPYLLNSKVKGFYSNILNVHPLKYVYKE